MSNFICISFFQLEKQLFVKKKDMSQFQRDYMDLKKKFEAAVERLKQEDKEIQESLTNREKLYEAAIEQSQALYSTQVHFSFYFTLDFKNPEFKFELRILLISIAFLKY